MSFNSQADLDYDRAPLAAREEPWTGALQALLSNAFCKPDRVPSLHDAYATKAIENLNAAANYLQLRDNRHERPGRPSPQILHWAKESHGERT